MRNTILMGKLSAGIKYLLLLALLTSPLTTLGQQAPRQELKEVSGADLGELLGISVRNLRSESYSGHYEYKLKDGQKVLHGQFRLSHLDSGTWIDAGDTTRYINQIVYTGAFVEGQRQGSFTETLHHDDGVDIFSKWLIKIDFSQDECQKAIFKGKMGYVMPNKTYTFNKPKNCSFEAIARLAGKAWQKEWEEQNK